jgi:hypothetical protein
VQQEVQTARKETIVLFLCRLLWVGVLEITQLLHQAVAREVPAAAAVNQTMEAPEHLRKETTEAMAEAVLAVAVVAPTQPVPVQMAATGKPQLLLEHLPRVPVVVLAVMTREQAFPVLAAAELKEKVPK